MKRLIVQQIWNPDWRPSCDFDNEDMDRHVYRVTKVVNDTEPYIGENITRETLQMYCDFDNWDVVIT